MVKTTHEILDELSENMLGKLRELYALRHFLTCFIVLYRSFLVV